MEPVNGQQFIILEKNGCYWKKDYTIESHNNGVYTCMREKLVRIKKRNKDIFESTN